MNSTFIRLNYVESFLEQSSVSDRLFRGREPVPKPVNSERNHACIAKQNVRNNDICQTLIAPFQTPSDPTRNKPVLDGHTCSSAGIRASGVVSYRVHYSRRLATSKKDVRLLYESVRYST